MSDIREDFYPDEAYESEQCATCDEPVVREEAFKDGMKFYHPDCAGVWRCEECGKWNENGQRCPCREPERPVAGSRRDDLFVVLAGLALILAFTLGLVLGVKVEQADQKLAARQAAEEVAR